MKRKMILPASLVLFALAAGACAPRTPTPETVLQLRAPNPEPASLAVIAAVKLQRLPGMGAIQNFGGAIALGKDVLAVGAPDRGGMPGNQEGRVFIFRRKGNNWVEQTQLASSDRADGFQNDQHFGTSLAMEGDTLFVGAPQADDRQAGDNTGAVYIFRGGPEGWNEIGRLTADQPVANAGFGNQLVVSGDTLVVGEAYDRTGVYIFQQQPQGWRQQSPLDAPQVEGFNHRSILFAIYGDTLAVSRLYSKGEAEQTQFANRVDIFEQGNAGWDQIESLSSEVDSGTGLGNPVSSISLGGSQGRADRLALGSAMDSPYGFGSGSVSIYERTPSGWVKRDTLTAPDGVRMDRFGGSVTLDGNRLLVGAGGASEDSFWDGVAYLFEYTQGRWIDQLRLVPPEDGGSGDFFGSQVAALDDTYLVAAPDEFGNAVYVYDIGPRP